MTRISREQMTRRRSRNIVIRNMMVVKARTQVMEAENQVMMGSSVTCKVMDRKQSEWPPEQGKEVIVNKVMVEARKLVMEGRNS